MDKYETVETDILFLKTIQDIVNGLNLLDEMMETIGERQSQVDMLLSDYYHILENDNKQSTELTNDSRLIISNKISELRKQRRHLKNEFTLSKVFHTYRDRLLYQEQRRFFTDEVYKKITEFNQPYNARVLTEEEIDNLYGKQKVMTKRKRSRSGGSELDEQIKKLYQEGNKQIDIAKKLGKHSSYICLRIKRMKELGELNENGNGGIQE